MAVAVEHKSPPELLRELLHRGSAPPATAFNNMLRGKNLTIVLAATATSAGR